MTQLRADVFGASKPIFMAEVAKVSFATFLLVQVAQCNVQAHGAISHAGGVELARLHLQAGIETHRPLHNVALSFGLRLDRTFHRSVPDPFLVGVPSGLFGARLALENPTFANAAQARLGDIADHLPTGSIAGGAFVAFPSVCGVDQQLHLIAEPRPAFTGHFVGVRVAVRHPARRVDAVQYVIGNIESEVEPLAVVLHVAMQREIFWVGSGRELRDPVPDTKELCGVVPFTFTENTVQSRSLARETVERTA